MHRLLDNLNFAKDETASASVGGIFFTVAALGMSGLALDQANAWAIQTQLQATADASAMAAATRIEDFDAARALALQVAEKNLNRTGVLDASGIVFGTWDPETAQFVSTQDPDLADAVQVTIDLSQSGGDAVPTYLLKFVGLDRWDIGATAIVGSREVVTGGGGTMSTPVSCAAATFLSTGYIQTGGGNVWEDDVCIHGATGVHTGGNDWYDSTVRLSAENINTITVNSHLPQSLAVEDFTAEEVITPTILPQLDTMWGELWSTLYSSGATSYAGDLLPSFVYENGPANIVVKNGWWSIQPGQVQPNTIYVVNGGAQFSGGIDAHNVAFIVNGYFGVGGGFNLHFDDVYIFAQQVNLAGNITWGPTGNECGQADEYSVYLFGRQSLSMGGWGQPTAIRRVVGASPQFSPGGAMTGSKVYFEFGAMTYNTNTSLGGNYRIDAGPCAGDLISFLPLADMGSEDAPSDGGQTVRMSKLYR